VRFEGHFGGFHREFRPVFYAPATCYYYTSAGLAYYPEPVCFARAGGAHWAATSLSVGLICLGLGLAAGALLLHRPAKKD